MMATKNRYDRSEYSTAQLKISTVQSVVESVFPAISGSLTLIYLHVMLYVFTRFKLGRY